MKYINQNKLNKIKLTKDNFFIVIDFDQTITSKNSQNSWEAIMSSSYISKEHIEKHNALYQKYKPIEIDSSLNMSYRIESMNEWYSSILQLFYENVSDEEVIRKAIGISKLEFRDGAKEFLQTMNNCNIPIIIVSAGIGNTIEEFLRINNVRFDNIQIISNFINFATKRNDYYVHALNKKEAIWENDIINKINMKKYAILIGDVIDDIKMLPNSIHSEKITIGFLDKNIDENLEKYRNSFDIILTDNSSFGEVEKVLGAYKEVGGIER